MSWCCHVRGLCDALYSWFVILADWIYNGILKYTGCRSVVNFTSLCSHDDPSIFFPALCSHVYVSCFLFQYKPEEIAAIMKDFDEPGSLAPTGLFLGGTKYMVIQGEPGVVIRGKKVWFETDWFTRNKLSSCMQYHIPETNSVHVCNTIVLMISTYSSIKGAILYQRCPGCWACCFSWLWYIIWWIPA